MTDGNPMKAELRITTKPTERTREEMANALKQWAKDRRDAALDGYASDEGLTELLDAAARRLREIPDGERIEVYTTERDIKRWREQGVLPSIYLGTGRSATLILHPPSPTAQKRTARPSSSEEVGNDG